MTKKIMTPLDKAGPYVKACKKSKKPYRRYRKDFVYPMTDNIVYIRIPKNASSSILAAERYQRRARDQKPRKDSRWGVNIEKADFSQIKWALVLTRNPFDRTVSCYRNRMKGIGGRNKEVRKRMRPAFMSRIKTFPEFVEVVRNIPDDYADEHYRSQSWFVEKIPSTTNICYIDVSEISEKWPIVLDLLEWDKETSLPHRRNSRSDTEPLKRQKLINEYYKDERVIDMVRERYKKDFELFGYSEEVSDY